MDSSLAETIGNLRRSLSEPLPGGRAQSEMAPPSRTPLEAAVLILLYPKNNIPYIALIKRAVQEQNDKHSGQISLPGGKVEPSDLTILDTAIRETYEEIGVPRSSVTTLGLLTSLYIPVSNFNVQPVVGYTEQTPLFKIDPNEVSELIECPLSLLKSKHIKKVKDIKVTNRAQHLTIKNVPYFDIEGHVVWGATAMILNEFIAMY